MLFDIKIKNRYKSDLECSRMCFFCFCNFKFRQQRQKRRRRKSTQKLIEAVCYKKINLNK